MVTEQPYDDFLGLYASLRALFSGDPQELIRLNQTSPDQDRVLQDIHALTHHVRSQETFGGRRKVVEYVPSQFKEAWSDYLKRWSTFVDYYIDSKNWKDDIFPLPPPVIYPDELLPPGDTRFKLPVQKPAPEEESEFDPLIHDGSGILEWIEGYLLNRTEDDPALADEVSNQCGIACDYLSFLRTDLRLDFAGIERRWRMVPLFLRPRHVVEHDLATGLSLSGNLNSAVVAFIFGADKAALALCRATLEMTLREFYVPDLSARPGLKEIVSTACREHELIRENKDRIDHFKEMADKALHRPDIGKVTDMARWERDVARFMELLAILIQSVPDRPGGLRP